MDNDGTLNGKLDELLSVAKDNNRILRAMRRDALIAGILKFVFWVVLFIASYYLTMQYLEPLLESFGGGAQNPEDFKAMFEQYKSLFE